MVAEPGQIVVGCVVLYECDVGITANLTTYANDLDALLVIDNSSTSDPAIAAAVAAFGNAEYHFNGANIGIAAALNLAVNWAHARHADFLLTMDQDSSFADRSFPRFKDRVLSLPFLDKLAVAAPSFGGEHAASVVAVVDSPTVITSGSLVSLANQSLIGSFDERLFIDEVDHDYCLRARDNGLRVVTLPDIRLRHRLGEARTVSILGRPVRWNIHSPLRQYYMVRNCLYMMSKHYRRHFGYSAWRLVRVARTITAAMILAPQRSERFGMVVWGVRDYFAMRMGARWGS